MNLNTEIKHYLNPRHNWSLSEILNLMKFPYQDLLFLAHGVHRHNFKANKIQVSTLINIKTGGCAEDCAYCSQSARYKTGLEKQQIMQLEEVIAHAKAAKKQGATRLCMGAAWRSPTKQDFPIVLEMVKAVKNLGLETCVTLGMLNNEQIMQLEQAGLDYYNHNLDTSESYYKQVITTRTFQDRLNTLRRVKDAKINVCSGGILGMGEQQKDRAQLLHTFANMDSHPQSVPLNILVPIAGTPLADKLQKQDAIDVIDFIKIVAATRLVLPKSYVRLSAGRNKLSKEAQASCFFAGANSIFYGTQLLTTDNVIPSKDLELFTELGMDIENIKLEKEDAVADFQSYKLNTDNKYYEIN